MQQFLPPLSCNFSSISADLSCWAVSYYYLLMTKCGTLVEEQVKANMMGLSQSGPLCAAVVVMSRDRISAHRGCGAPASNIIPFPLISMSIAQRYKKFHRSLRRRRSCLLVGKPGMGGKYQVAECSLVQQYHVAVDLLAAANCCWWFWRDIIRPLWVLIFCVILFILFSSNRVILESN